MRLKPHRSSLRDDVDDLVQGRSRHDELVDNTNTQVTDIVDIDRTAELFIYLFSSLFGKKDTAGSDKDKVSGIYVCVGVCGVGTKFVSLTAELVCSRPLHFCRAQWPWASCGHLLLAANAPSRLLVCTRQKLHPAAPSTAALPASPAALACMHTRALTSHVTAGLPLM